MPAATRQQVTVLEGLQKIGQQVAALKYSPDAMEHIDFLGQLETQLIGYVQHASTQQAGAGGMGGPPGATPSTPTPDQAPPGVMPGAAGQLPPVDDLRRLM